MNASCVPADANKNLPEAYRIGNIPFVHADIDLSLRPLIPRVETEYWVSEVIKTLTPPPTSHLDSGEGHATESASPLAKGEVSVGQRGSVKLNVLDAFAGSGCIGVAILKDIPNAHVDFLEKDPELKKQISINLARNGIAKSRTRIIIGEFPEKMPRRKYGYIFANPPYIDPAKRRAVQTSVLDHEPHDALFAKDRGLYYIKQLIKLAPPHLLSGGRMWIEFGMGQKRKIEGYVKANGSNFKFLRDQYKRWRVLEISVE